MSVLIDQTGTLRPDEEVDLAFETSGKIVNINFTLCRIVFAVSDTSPSIALQAFNSWITEGSFSQPIGGWRLIAAPSKASPLQITAVGEYVSIAYKSALNAVERIPGQK